MNLEKTLSTAVVVAALCAMPLPSSAQERHERGGRPSSGQPAQREQGGSHAAARQAPREAAPQSAPRPSENRSYQAPAPQASPRYDTRSYSAPSYSGPSHDRGYADRAVPRPYASPSYRPGDRYDDHRRYEPPSRSYGYARPYSRDFYYARPYYGRSYARPYGWSVYRPYYFSRPYYAFDPWFNIGFGLWIGHSVPYPWGYLGTYRPRVYGYVDNSYGYDVNAGTSIYGGISFDIQPSDADLWVDGDYVGTVGTFTPFGEPLTLTPGQHRIVVQRNGYRTMEWDVQIEPGQVFPYRGQMERF